MLKEFLAHRRYKRGGQGDKVCQLLIQDHQALLSYLKMPFLPVTMC